MRHLTPFLLFKPLNPLHSLRISNMFLYSIELFMAVFNSSKFGHNLLISRTFFPSSFAALLPSSIPKLGRSIVKVFSDVSQQRLPIFSYSLHFLSSCIRRLYSTLLLSETCSSFIARPLLFCEALKKIWDFSFSFDIQDDRECEFTTGKSLVREFHFRSLIK